MEYAIEAIKLGSTALAIQTRFGIVLAVEKRITSPLMEAQSMDKIMEIDSHCAAAVSGLTADAKTMVEHGRVESQNLIIFAQRTHAGGEFVPNAVSIGDVVRRRRGKEHESTVWSGVISRRVR